MPAPPPSSRALSRRTAIGGMVSAGAVLSTGLTAGCTPATVERPRATVTPAPVRRPGTDPDVVLASRVLAQEQALLALVRATVRAHPRLARTAAGAEAAHRAHVRLLGRAVPPSAPSARPSPAGPPDVPRRPGPALAALARAEDGLAEQVRRSALRAESGGFARVLASMAAAAAQQGVHLSTARTGR